MEQPGDDADSTRRFWLLCAASVLPIGWCLHWRGLPMVLVPETTALLAFLSAGLLNRMLDRLTR